MQKTSTLIEWTCWYRRLGYMPLATIQQMMNTCQGLDDLQGESMPHNYISANVKIGGAANWDQPLQNLTHAQKQLQVVQFDLFGPWKQTSFAGHSCCVFVDDHSRWERGSIQSRSNRRSLIPSKVSMLIQLWSAANTRSERGVGQRNDFRETESFLGSWPPCR